MTEPTRGESSYYTDQDIARLLGISLGRLRNKLTAGNPLPPRIGKPNNLTATRVDNVARVCHV